MRLASAGRRRRPRSAPPCTFSPGTASINRATSVAFASAGHAGRCQRERKSCLLGLDVPVAGQLQLVVHQQVAPPRSTTEKMDARSMN
jgi:hypothetical protein